MSFTNQEIEEFKTEALELLESAEKSLLALDEGSNFKDTFDRVFRSFHNLKGASGMMEMLDLQAHTHELENILMPFKDKSSMCKNYVSFFLRGIDAARQILDGNKVQFDYKVEGADPSSEQLRYVPKNESPEPVELPKTALQEFFTEAFEILERFDKNLRVIESNSFSKEVVDELYRDIHSLKGTSYLFGFQEVGELSHVLESSMETLRSGKLQVSAELLHLYFKCVEVFEKSLKSIQEGTPSSELQGTINQMKQQITQFKTEPVPVEVKKTPPSDNTVKEKESEANASIRVPVALLDNLMTLMGEMVLVRNQVIQFSSRSDNYEFLNLSKRLNVVTSEIQSEMMKTRMQPVGNILTKFHRVVRDLSMELKKNITLTLSGAETELDKSLLEAIKDPLTHIIRNSCDHGIEQPEARREKGKPEVGVIHVKAYHEGGQVVIEVSDDGKGLHKDMLIKKALEKGIINQSQVPTLSDKEILNLIFAPGFSTAATVTNVSGRGVGMDVVRTNVEKIGGSVELSSVANRGTTTRLKIPLTLAIIPALTVRSSGSLYAIPQLKLEELVRVDSTSATDRIEYLQGAPIYRLRGQILPLVNLGETLGEKQKSKIEAKVHTIAVLNAEHIRFGLVVDEIQDTGDIVVKPINRLLKSLQVYSGATILGDGSIALILDVNGISKVSGLDTHNKYSDESTYKENENKERLLDQDYILFDVNSPTTHGIVLNYVFRLEEFSSQQIEFSGSQRVIRYGDKILPLLSVNDLLGYPEQANQWNQPKLKVIVIKKAGSLYGLVVNNIEDTMTSNREVEVGLNKQLGIYGNLSTSKKLIVIVDAFELIEKVYPLSAADPAGTTLEQIQRHSTKTSKLKILLAEDTAFFRKAIFKVLKEAGHEVTIAADGREALDMLEQNTTYFDLVISDIEMPRMNGFDLALNVRKNPALSNIPLLAVSSNADSAYKSQGLQSGFNIYLEKLKPELLLKSVSQLFDSQRRSA